MGFLHRCRFQQCFGLIDGSHIRIIGPTRNHQDYFNRKEWHSIVSQALVDHEYRFTNTYVRWPGSVHDAQIFSNSDLYAKGESDQIMPSGIRRIKNVDVPVIILGDATYLMLPWIMKPYDTTYDSTWNVES